MYIYKYIIPISGYDPTKGAIIRIPEGANILSARNQYENMAIWVQFSNKSVPLEERKFKLIVTGEYFVADNLVYVDTILFCNGDLVIHLFEEK